MQGNDKTVSGKVSVRFVVPIDQRPFYKTPVLPLIALHPAASLLQATSRILCNMLHKVCEALCKGTDTDRLDIQGGGINPAPL